MIKVFICYVSEDIEYAEKLYWDLKIRDVAPWWDKKCLKVGQNWKLEIKKAIRESDFFVALLSKKSTTRRGFVQKEIRQALEVLEECAEGKIFLLPVRIEECEIHFELLREIHYVDLFPNWYQGLDKILKVIVGYGESENIRESIIKEIKSARQYIDKRAGILINKVSRKTNIHSYKIIPQLYIMKKEGIIDWGGQTLEADSMVELTPFWR